MRLLVCFITVALLPGWAEGAKRVDAKTQLEKIVATLGGTSHRARREARRLSVRNLMEAGPETDFQVGEISNTVQGTRLWKMKEIYRGKEVYDTQMTIETDPSGAEVIDATGVFVQDIDKDTDGSPIIYASEAVDNVLKDFGDREDQARDIKVDLKIFVDKDDQAFPGYQVEYKIEEEGNPRRPTAIVDGRDGRVVLSWNSMTTFCSDSQGTGIGGNNKTGDIFYNGEDKPCLNVTKVGDVCYLENENLTVIDMGGKKWYNITETMTYDCHNANDAINGANSPALDAFFIGSSAYKMFDEWYGMKPLVGDMQLVIRVHFGTNYPNAFWNGVNATFGDGRGHFFPFVSIDLLGHEIGHALVEQHSGLIWFNQPGAVNEAFADITGEVLEYYIRGTQDWFTGYDIIKGNRSVRYFVEPEKNYISISNMNKLRNYMEPHQTGGILAHAFYRIVHLHNQTMRQAYEVFLHANRMYWHHMSSIQSAVCELMKSAYDLGQPGHIYKQAFEYVGVEVCNVSDHVMGLHNNQTITGVKVSNTTRPIYTFGVPAEWTDTVFVEATSAQGPVLITITDKTWMDAHDPDDVDILAQDYEFASFNLTDIGQLYVTITLSSDSDQLWTDVSVKAGFTCLGAGETSHGYFEYMRKENCEGRSY
ncbi:elastase-like [Babylonia areolata]|uniref:elastase-like n=1 Tax=Babylonia areolata TaxID=304850 RepID=UPI003FD36BA3